MPRRPLDQFESVAVWVREPGCPRPVRSAWKFEGTGRDPRLRHGVDGRLQVIDLNGEMAETRADGNVAVRRPVNELECDDLVVRKLEHDQACAIAELDTADDVIAEGCVEGEGDAEVGDATGGVQGPHAG